MRISQPGLKKRHNIKLFLWASARSLYAPFPPFLYSSPGTLFFPFTFFLLLLLFFFIFSFSLLHSSSSDFLPFIFSQTLFFFSLLLPLIFRSRKDFSTGQENNLKGANYLAECLVRLVKFSTTIFFYGEAFNKEFLSRGKRYTFRSYGGGLVSFYI